MFTCLFRLRPFAVARIAGRRSRAPVVRNALMGHAGNGARPEISGSWPETSGKIRKNPARRKNPETSGKLRKGGRKVAEKIREIPEQSGKTLEITVPHLTVPCVRLGGPWIS